MKLLHCTRVHFLRHLKEYNQHLMNYSMDWPVTSAYCIVHLRMLHILFQVTLGISTLLMYVPSLGSAHQAGALTLLSPMILLTHTLRRPSPALLKSLVTAVKSTWYHVSKISSDNIFNWCVGLIALWPTCQSDESLCNTTEEARPQFATTNMHQCPCFFAPLTTEAFYQRKIYLWIKCSRF